MYENAEVSIRTMQVFLDDFKEGYRVAELMESNPHYLKGLGLCIRKLESCIDQMKAEQRKYAGLRLVTEDDSH